MGELQLSLVHLQPPQPTPRVSQTYSDHIRDLTEQDGESPSPSGLSVKSERLANGGPWDRLPFLLNVVCFSI